MKMLIVFLLGIAIGSGAAVAYLQIAAEPQFIWHSDKGGLMKVTPANTYRAIDMAGEYCKRFRAYPVLTETTVHDPLRLHPTSGTHWSLGKTADAVTARDAKRPSHDRRSLPT